MDLIAAVLQTDPALVEQLQRIADYQRWMMVAAVLVALAALAIALFALRVLLKARQMLNDAQRRVNEMAPRLAPSLQRVRQIIDATGDTVEDVRSRVGEISATFDDLNQSLRAAGRGAETRVKELAAVIDVVRAEAEELLLDGAATAHGIHTTAKALRAPRPTGQVLRPEPPPPLPEEVRRTSHGQG